jgi:hypothetical protein
MDRQDFGTWLPAVLHNLDAQQRSELLEAVADLQATASEYRTWLASEVGTSERLQSVPAAPLSHAISVREAAGMLRVSDRRVRQLCEDGVINGRRDGWAWSVDRASVVLYRGRVAS